MLIACRGKNPDRRFGPCPSATGTGLGLPKPLLSPQGGGLLERRARDARVPTSEQRPSMPGKTSSLSLGRGLG